MEDSDSMDVMVRDAAHSFLSARAKRERLRGWVARSRPVDRALWRQSADLGWCGLLLPESMGGMGAGMAQTMVLAGQAGRGLFAEPLVAAAVMPAVLLAAADTGPAPEQAAALAQSLNSGERLLTLAWQEAMGQLHLDTQLGAPSCELTDGRLQGRKLFVPACEPDSTLLVFAHAAGEPLWLAVEATAPGVQCQSEPAGLGTHTTVDFAQVAVAPAQVLLRGAPACHALAWALAAGRLALASELAGLAVGCLALTLEHVRTRQQFDRPLGSFQTVQHRCVDLHLECELAQASCQQALALYPAQPQGAPLPELEAAICAAKARAGEAAVRVGREAVQLHGAMGFCDEVDVGLYLRAALYGNAWLGGPVALRRRFAALRSNDLESAHG